jgi:heat shock protein HslJ
MACEHMEIENGLNKALVTADNYSLNGDNLSLNKARMAPLARFKAVK